MTQPPPMRTLYLMAEPSFWSGVARVFDLFGADEEYNLSPTPEEADARAMYADWRMTGEDLARAMAAYDEETRGAAHAPTERSPSTAR